jgi:hypothetical protein
MDAQESIQRQVKRWIWFFMIVLALSGLTAIPVVSGINFLNKMTEDIRFMQPWIERVQVGITDTSNNYPFLFYGYDWLAFAHFVLAILFIGPLRNPVRNRWVIEFGLIACVLIVPFALIAGHFRGIPMWWRLIDCSFGIIGILPLSICLRKINWLETYEEKNQLVYGNEVAS